MNDNITHPKHYTSHPSGVECIEITRHYNYNIGNAIKYLWRAGIKKEPGKSDKEKEIEDLQKAVWYIQDYINTLQQENLSLNKNNHNCSCNCKCKKDNTTAYIQEKDNGHYVGLDR